jgi:hypothetical protein
MKSSIEEEPYGIKGTAPIATAVDWVNRYL